MKICALMLAAVALSAVAPESFAATLMKDNFHNDPVGQFPSDWQLLYDGAGTNYQVVDTTQAKSKPNALNLVGSSCWSADAYHPVTLPEESNRSKYAVLSGDIFIGQIGYGGCEPDTGAIALIDPSIGEWGTAYTGVEFNDDGYIHAISGSSYPQLRHYRINRWYHIEIDANLTAQTSNIYINNTLIATDLPFTASGTPTGVSLHAGHGTTPVVWFDNISVKN
jgi:hypothetical protein